MLLDLDWISRWPNFAKPEIYSPESLAKYQHILSPDAMDTLQAFRLFLKKPILVNYSYLTLRGVRTVIENQTIKDFKQESMHITGRAFDISVSDLDIELLYEACIDFDAWKGIGKYTTWIHVDTRLSSSAVIW